MTTLYIKPTFMVGSDCEAPIRSVVDGSLQSALDCNIDGTKEHPFKLPSGAVQVDNVNVEFNSNPSTTVDLFVRNHRLIMDEVADYLSLKGIFMDTSISSFEATRDMLMNPLAMVGGCEPDYNAWKQDGFAINPKPFYDLVNLRASAAHLHISSSLCDDDHDYINRVKIVKALDLVLGVPSVLMDTNGAARRKIYGKAGACRYKNKSDGSYNGVEYRVLSNFWLQSDELMAWAFKGVEHVINHLDELSSTATDYKSSIVKAINKNDKTLAEKLVNNFGLITV